MALEHNHPFDPTYGYDLPGLLAVPAPPGPGDFAAFWQTTYAQARQIPLQLTRRRIASPQPDWELYEIEYDSWDGVRIGAWLTVPADGRVERGVVVGHGYGGSSGPEFNLPGPPAVAIFPCARGFDRSAHPLIPGEAFSHVRVGIGSREKYVHRGCVVDFWAGATALLELYPAVAQRLDYYGGSFGGGIGALLLPWDGRFRKAFLAAPSFGNHPLRVTLPCVGSGESVRRYWREHPAVLDVLAYYDAATAARHTQIPVFVAAAVFDPAVPPPGQFAVYNGLAGPRELFVREAAHFNGPNESREYAELTTRLNVWFAD